MLNVPNAVHVASRGVRAIGGGGAGGQGTGVRSAFCVIIAASLTRSHRAAPD